MLKNNFISNITNPLTNDSKETHMKLFSLSGKGDKRSKTLSHREVPTIFPKIPHTNLAFGH
jgi:hypothetical protein